MLVLVLERIVERMRSAVCLASARAGTRCANRHAAFEHEHEYEHEHEHEGFAGEFRLA